MAQPIFKPAPIPTNLDSHLQRLPSIAHLTLSLPLVIPSHFSPQTALSHLPPSQALPLTVGMLQDPVDEHRVLGDTLSHQEDALLYTMPLQHGRAGHLLQEQRRAQGQSGARGEGNGKNAGA